jgi:hypothetical protein
VSIKGQVQKREVNKFGYLRLKVSGEWYGADKKGEHPVAEGDIVEMETFQNDRGYETFKFQSLRKVAAAVKGAPVDKGPTASKDEYWAEKEARDLAKEPRINYYAAFERATGFVALAFQVGALSALTKAKDTAKLDVLTALVDEQTQRILVASYSQEAPAAESDTTPSSSNEGDADSTTQSSEGDNDQWK